MDNSSTNPATDTHVGKAETQLKEWGAKIDAFIAKGSAVVGDAQVEYRKGLDELKAKQATAQTKFADLKAAGNDKWDTLKSGIETAFADLEGTFKKLTKN